MRIAVLGAGYAGLTLARQLDRALTDADDLIVINESPDHLLQHELHRIIRRPDFADEITVPLETVLEQADVRIAEVRNIDFDECSIALDGSDEINYDFAAVCLGADPEFYDLGGVQTHATPLKRLTHARSIREEFLSLLETGGSVVVGGAGLSGVQTAGELAALAEEQDGRSVDILLLEQYETVAPGFPDNFQDAVQEALESRGVTVRTGSTVEGATAEEIHLDGEEIPYEQFIWTGGIRGSAALAGTRPEVPPTLRYTDETFVVGDAAKVVDRDGERIPPTAQAAIEEGKTAAENIERLVEYARTGGVFEPRLETIDFHPTGWIVSVGDGAIAQVGPMVLRGRTALALKASVGVGYLSSIGTVRQAVELAIEEFGDS